MVKLTTINEQGLVAERAFQDDATILYVETGPSVFGKKRADHIQVGDMVCPRAGRYGTSFEVTAVEVS